MIWTYILPWIAQKNDTTLKAYTLRNGSRFIRCVKGKVNRAICAVHIFRSKWVYTRFFKKLFKHEELMNKIFDKLVDTLATLLPDFGKNLAMDSKAISSLAKHENHNTKKDGRRDTDADYGRKEYRGIREDGTAWEKIIKWFGYKLHLIIDTTRLNSVQ